MPPLADGLGSRFPGTDAPKDAGSSTAPATFREPPRSPRIPVRRRHGAAADPKAFTRSIKELIACCAAAGTATATTRAATSPPLQAVVPSSSYPKQQRGRNWLCTRSRRTGIAPPTPKPSPPCDQHRYRWARNSFDRDRACLVGSQVFRSSRWRSETVLRAADNRSMTARRSPKGFPVTGSRPTSTQSSRSSHLPTIAIPRAPWCTVGQRALLLRSMRMVTASALIVTSTPGQTRVVATWRLLAPSTDSQVP